MSIQVIKPGALSQFQDSGRVGFQKLGVPVCGPMDVSAHRLANILTANDESTPTLEITLLGPTLRFTKSACIALTGARLGARLDGNPLAANRPHVVSANQILSFAGPESGVRSYLSVHGGFGLLPVLNSCSTYLKGSLGGAGGRALKAGDRIELNAPLSLSPGALEDCKRSLWQLKIYLSSSLGLVRKNTLRVIKGPHWAFFTDDSVNGFLTQRFKISPQSDRMGYRISGPKLQVRDPRQILSEATVFGAVQVPQGGDPIILMADRQTMGGYPKIACLASVDLPSLAQSRPADEISFKLISLEEAQQLDLDREHAFNKLAQSLTPVKHILNKGLS
jgi:biotin-dependent carboxylase-like uncharacterized protein